MKIVYFGNNMFSSCLKYLIEEGHQILRVYKNKPEQGSSIISRLCESNNIPLFEHKPDAEELNELILLGVEMFIVAEYLYLLPSIDVKYAINIHPTLLPMGRGPTPLPYLIKHPESSGITIHKMTGNVDAGDIILHSSVPIFIDDSITTLMVKIHVESLHLIKKLFSNVDGYYDEAIPQVNHSDWPKIEIVDRILDWALPTRNIKFLARCFGFIGLIVKLDNVMWNVVHLEAVEYRHTYQPGMVIFEDESLLTVSCLDGIVCIYKASLSLLK